MFKPTAPSTHVQRMVRRTFAGAERVPISIVMLPNPDIHVALIAACSATSTR